MSSKEYIIKMMALNYIDYCNRKVIWIIGRLRSLDDNSKRRMMLYAKCKGIVGHDRILNER